MQLQLFNENNVPIKGQCANVPIEKNVPISEQRKKLINLALRYIAHSRNVYGHSHDRHEASRKIAICEELHYNMRKLFEVYSYSQVRGTIKSFSHQFRAILPNEHNRSYLTSEKQLNEILQKAQGYGKEA